jgi:hypothetical protein
MLKLEVEITFLTATPLLTDFEVSKLLSLGLFCIWDDADFPEVLFFKPAVEVVEVCFTELAFEEVEDDRADEDRSF